MWSDTTDKYADARIIFTDSETSNWTWDPVAQEYYWHRFYSHQPDLNFDSPDVRREMFRILDYWFELGVDGVRLDAIPYLYEREGTNCENLARDARLPEVAAGPHGRALPGPDAAGRGQPVAGGRGRVLRRRRRVPHGVPLPGDAAPVPGRCRWRTGRRSSTSSSRRRPCPTAASGRMFLRNHDELTLEMVTDEERDYMYRRYAGDPRMRVNVGIRRRLTTLLQDDRRKVELLNALLLSLPGTPIIYYGDEIGMGDNVYLGDRDSVRTPMQWSDDRNAGFSDGDPQRLFLPLITDSQHHYESINVEAQRRNPSSLWWWMRRMIAMRQRNPVFARGEMHDRRARQHQGAHVPAQRSRTTTTCSSSPTCRATPSRCSIPLAGLRRRAPGRAGRRRRAGRRSTTTTTG